METFKKAKLELDSKNVDEKSLSKTDSDPSKEKSLKDKSSIKTTTPSIKRPVSAQSIYEETEYLSPAMQAVLYRED